jgi:hypothetical protein
LKAEKNNKNQNNHEYGGIAVSSSDFLMRSLIAAEFHSDFHGCHWSVNILLSVRLKTAYLFFLIFSSVVRD